MAVTTSFAYLAMQFAFVHTCHLKISHMCLAVPCMAGTRQSPFTQIARQTWHESNSPL